MLKQSRSASGPACLHHIEEFCASFPSAAIVHDLTFHNVDCWRQAGALLDAAEANGFKLLWSEFEQINATAELKMRLLGGPECDFRSLMRRINSPTGVMLIDWQTRARYVRQV